MNKAVLMTFALTTLAIFLGLVLGKQISLYAIKPLGIPIAAGDPQSQGRVTA